jgi:dihydrofolate reductase
MRQGASFWGAPDEEVSEFINDTQRPVGTYLYGRRMYETMLFWETAQVADEPPCVRDFTDLWKAADKIVYSTSLERVSSRRTRLVREFDPGVIQAMKDVGDRDVAMGGSDLSAQAFKAGIVDECHLYVTPVAVGGGKPALPVNVHLELELLGEHRFGSSVPPPPRRGVEPPLRAGSHRPSHRRSLPGPPVATRRAVSVRPRAPW